MLVSSRGKYLMHFLVTGGSGFIGTNLINVLQEKKISLLNLDIRPPKKKEHVYREDNS